MIRNLLVAGGDLRMEQMARLLVQDGYRVERIVNGHDSGWQEKAAFTDALLLPYPHSLKDGKIPGWEHGGEVLEELLSRLNKDTLVMAGSGIDNVLEECRLNGQQFRVTHYADDQIFAERNAEISAEAAVSEVMLRSNRMLDEQNILVLGYGLFARAILWRLRVLGARVWVAARREKIQKQAIRDGAQAIGFDRIEQLAPQIHVVMNTVPSVVMGEKELSLFSDDTLFLELASPPYGIDLSAAVALEKNVAVLPGLPSRYASLSAAKALRETVQRRIEEASI